MISHMHLTRLGILLSKPQLHFNFIPFLSSFPLADQKLSQAKVAGETCAVCKYVVEYIDTFLDKQSTQVSLGILDCTYVNHPAVLSMYMKHDSFCISF